MTADELVDRIADGTAELLTIDDVCARLSISRPTLERWRRNKQFPAADIQLGKSPRWSMDTFKTWLETQTHRDKK